LSGLVPAGGSLGEAVAEDEFIIIPKNASADASLRIRACKTGGNRATWQTFDPECDAD
jgi:hypothetical protein